MDLIESKYIFVMYETDRHLSIHVCKVWMEDGPFSGNSVRRIILEHVLHISHVSSIP